MDSNTRSHWCLVMIVAATILTLTACGKSRKLVYRATGSVPEVTVVYTDADGTPQEETVTLPWETHVDVSQKFDFELRISNTSPTGKIACEVWLDDRKLGERTSAAYAVCMGFVSVKGGGTSTNFFSSYSVETYLGDANTLLNEGELENALTKVESARDVAPNFANVYFMQGLVYRKMDQPDHALTAYDQAIALNPNLTVAYNNRGGIYQAMGEFNLAVADYTAAIELDPEDMMYYRNRSRTYFAMGNLEAARADVLKMQTLTDDPETLAELESALKELDQLVESKTP